MSCKLSTSLLPGIWVIETLARSNIVDVSLLLDLLKTFPQTSDDLGGNARELVSFRILEGFLFRGPQSISLSSSSPKIAFDPSKSCEDVLSHILLETPILTLKATGPEMWKWDVQAFLAHKRNSFGNHSLLQLKNAILTGSHSILASLKERSGLPFGNQSPRGLLENSGECNGIVHRFEITDSNNSIVQGNDQISPASVDNGYLDLPIENLLPVKRKRSSSTKNVGGKSCKDQIISKKGCENNPNYFMKNDIIQCEQDSGGNLLADKMLMIVKYSEIGLNGRLENDDDDDERICSDVVLPCEKQATHCNTVLPNDKCDDEHELENEIREGNGDKEGLKTDEGMETFELYIETNVENVDAKEKIHIHSDNQCTYSSATNVREQNLLADICAEIVESREVLGHSSKRTCLGGMGQNGLHRDANSEFTSLKGVISHENIKVPNEKNHDDVQESCRNVPDPADVDVRSDSDEYRDECTDIVTKKNAFLSSQCTFVQTVDISSQLNICVICKKGGEVLVCSTNSCPLVIHGSCSSRLSFGTIGEFYCPFCAYSQALSSYMDAKKNVSSKRKDLTDFVCLEARKEPKKQPEHDDGLHKSDELNIKDTEDCINNHNARGKNVDLTNQVQSPYPLTIYREGKIYKGVLCSSEAYLSDESKCSAHTEYDDALEISEYSGDPKHSSRVQKHKKRIPERPKIPQFRRRRVLWTTAEEDKLKEGIQIFYNPDEQIPWKQILNFGSGVFQESRNTIDLKDKWRSLCKTYPEYENLLKR